VGILSGKRPERPTHPSLTDELWDLIQRCWDQEPQLRPGISEVVSYLQAALATQGDCEDGTSVPTTVCTVSMNSRKRESSHRASSFLTFYVVVSHDRQVYTVNRRLYAGFRRFTSLPDHFPNVRPLSANLLGWSLESGKNRSTCRTLPPVHAVFYEGQPFGFLIQPPGLNIIATVAFMAVRRNAVREKSGRSSSI